MDKKEYFLYVKGKAVKVNEEIYRAYWRIKYVKIPERILVKIKRKTKILALIRAAGFVIFSYFTCTLP